MEEFEDQADVQKPKFTRTSDLDSLNLEHHSPSRDRKSTPRTIKKSLDKFAEDDQEEIDSARNESAQSKPGQAQTNMSKIKSDHSDDSSLNMTELD